MATTLQKLTKLTESPYGCHGPLLTPGNETIAGESRVLARVKAQLTDGRYDTKLDPALKMLMALESEPKPDPFVFSLDRITQYKSANLCGFCNGDYTKVSDCKACGGSGKSECPCCESVFDCSACDGSGKTDECGCDHGWSSSAAEFECEILGTKVLFKPQLIEHTVKALGEIRVFLSEPNRLDPTSPAYFTWSEGDGVIAPCRV